MSPRPLDVTSPLTSPVIGRVRVRDAREIADSMIGIGAETIDRDFVDFSEIREHLGPLGAKTVRLQAGWAKCEPEVGRYDFAWLDEIVDGVRDAGLEPWLETSYGNPIYDGGGGTSLHGGYPTSPEALDAWDRWVSALAAHFAGRVSRWEIWNEPDLLKDHTVVEYSRLYLRTARAIRARIPSATLTALALAIPGEPEYTRAFLRYLKERDALDLVDEISFHGYLSNPDIAYDDVDVDHGRRGTVPPLVRTIREFSTRITVLQGETGCPSTETVGALGQYTWTELSQAKWALRRLVTDIGHGVPACYFQIADMNYRAEHVNPWNGMNTKGLLRMDPDLKFVYRKPAYRAVQSLASIFDCTLEPMHELQWTAASTDRVRVYGFRQEASWYSAIVYWKSVSVPSEDQTTSEFSLDLAPVRIEHPVLVDLLTGTVHALPDGAWAADTKSSGSVVRFDKLPLYDSPVVVADAACLAIESIA